MEDDFVIGSVHTINDDDVFLERWNAIKEDRTKPKYWIEIIKHWEYHWCIKGKNGQYIAESKSYDSRHQCLRTAKAFADVVGLEIR